MRAATILKPACSNLEVICPMAFFATASGLTMDKVRSTAMQDLRLDSGSDARNSPNVLFYQAFAGASRPAWGLGLAVRPPLPKGNSKAGENRFVMSASRKFSISLLQA